MVPRECIRAAVEEEDDEVGEFDGLVEVEEGLPLIDQEAQLLCSNNMHDMVMHL